MNKVSVERQERPGWSEPRRSRRDGDCAVSISWKHSLKRLVITLRFHGIVITIDIPP